MTKWALGIALAAVFVVSMTTTAFASGHLTLDDASAAISGERVKADITTTAAIPLDGASGAFGYAVLSDGGNGALDNVAVLVTHLPIDDSSHEDPESGFHTHVLDLKEAENKCKRHGSLEVDLAGSGANQAFDSDYQWIIEDNVAKIRNIPTSDLGDPSEVAAIAAFTVTPLFAGDNLTNLCVNVTDLS